MAFDMDIQACDRALQKAKIALMTKPDSVFFSDLVLSFKFNWNSSIDTAYVAGTTVTISPQFFMGLNQEERIGLILHEIMHPVYLHPVRIGNRNLKKFNIAGDHVINLGLLDRGFQIPACGYADESYIGMTTEQVYDLIPDSQVPPDFIPDIVPGGDNQELENRMEEIIIRASIRSKQENDKPGTIPGDIELFIDSLLNPKIKWNQLLAKYKTKYAKTEYSFTSPRRRFLPMILPGMKSHDLIDLTIAADISGSVTDQEFKQFVSEFAGIFKTCKPEKITLIQFDTQIKSVEPLKSISDLMNVKFKGRGGTDIRPVIDWANKNKPELLLVFTDGEFKFHSTEYKKDLIWIIHNNKRFTAPYGKVSHYSI